MSIRINEALNTLNKEQKEAVIYDKGPLFVVAGAGTGKTKTLTTRIAYLISNKKVDPENILGVTFTNKAAREIRQRVDDIAHPYQMGSWLYTFHAFGLRVLRENIEALNLGYNRYFTVIDEEDARRVVRDVLNDLNLDVKSYPVRMVRSILSDYKMELIQFSDIAYHNIYDRYQEYLRKEQLMDFDDLLVNTYTLLKENKEVREKYQNKFEHILIDEFQDTDKIQYEIIKILSEKHKNTFVVGDPDQSIYAFRGARYENNKLFIEDFNAETIILDENYRSTNNILNVANSLIKHNENRPTSKELRSNLGHGYPVTFNRAEDDFQESYYVANEINSLIRQGYKYEDIAVLYRNNSLSRLFEHSLNQNQIPYIIYGGLSFYERKEVKDILAYVKVLVDEDNDFFLKRIINVPTRGIGNVTISKLEDYAITNGLSMFEAIDSINIGGRAKSALKEFKSLIRSIQEELKQMEDIVEVIDILYKKTGYQQMLKDMADDKVNERIDNIYELKNVFRQGSWRYSGTNELKIRQILDEIALYTDADKKTDNDNVVKLATIHQVKGLEFKVVFVVAMEEGIFPNERSSEDIRELEEERRIAYVALTRAKERLYVTCTQKRMLYGQVRYLTPSQFINEMQVAENKQDHDIDSNQVTQGLDFVYKEGDIVNHSSFGKGVVVSSKNGILTIAFSAEHGIKKLIEDHPAITKIK